MIGSLKLKAVVALLIIAYVALYFTFEHNLKGPDAFLFEYLEGAIPWLVIVGAVWIVRRGLRRRPTPRR